MIAAMAVLMIASFGFTSKKEAAKTVCNCAACGCCNDGKCTMPDCPCCPCK